MDIYTFALEAGIAFDIRVVTRAGSPWFVLPDVCKAIGAYVYDGKVNTAAAQGILKADERWVAGVNEIHPWPFDPRAKTITLVSESGLYKLILRSDKPQARRFQDWVTREVLPAIRKDGAYVMGEERVRTGELSEDELILKAMEALQRKVSRLTAERDRLAVEKAEAEARAEFAETELNNVTVDEYRALAHRYMHHAEKVRLAHMATALARQRGIALAKQRRVIRDRLGFERVVSVNVYPRSLLEEAERLIAEGHVPPPLGRKV